MSQPEGAADDLDLLRQEAIRTLSVALASDRLSVEQFENRLALVRQSPNRATLDAILADLVPSGPFTAPVALVRRAHDLPALAPIEPAEVLRIANVFGSSKRAGSWTVPLRLELKVVFGEMTIDLRDAVFCSDVLDIDVHATFSSVKLIVPQGTQVENECEERFSSSTHAIRSGRGRAVPSLGLLIRITGRVVFSSLEIKEKAPTGQEPAPGWKKLLGAAE